MLKFRASRTAHTNQVTGSKPYHEQIQLKLWLQRKKKKDKVALHTLLRNFLLASCLWSSGMTHLEVNVEEKKERKKAVAPNHTAPSANAPPHGTRHHRTANVPGPPQRHRTGQSWNTSRNYCRAATRHAPSGRDPGLWRDLVRHWLSIISIQLLTPVFPHSNAAHQQHTGTTQQHATAPAANRPPDRQHPSAPQTARSAFSVSCELPRATRLCCSSGTFETVVQLRHQAFNKSKEKKLLQRTK